MSIIKLETLIHAPIELVFDLTRDIDLHMATVPHTKERAIAGRVSGPVEPGDTITFEAVHLGLRQTLSSRITDFQAPYYFVDEMQKGAFKSLRHEHRFEAVGNDATIMWDTLSFESPFGILGRLVNRLFLERYMRSFLIERNHNLKRLIESGEWRSIVKKPASY
jgi:ligand-binding SRPBCC domain-containing protein